MNYQFTDEDKLIPIYCIGCRQHIPRTVSKSNRGLCPVCVAKIQATHSTAPPPAQPTPPPPNPQYQQHQPGYYQPVPQKPMPTGGIIVLVLVSIFCIISVGLGLIGNLNGKSPKSVDLVNTPIEDTPGAFRPPTQAEKQEAADKAMKAAWLANEEKVRGIRPEESPWDGITPEVNDYLQATLKDYDSLKIAACYKVQPYGTDKWSQHVKYRAKNGFGAYDLADQIFIIKNGQVVAVIGE
jgi:hypothetical protein